MLLARRVAVLPALLIAVAGLAVTHAPLARADATNLIADPGFEAAGAGWTPDSWGTNDAALTLVSAGRTGAAAAQTVITTYSDGDAKWMPTPVGVTGGAGYTYTDWYHSDATTDLWAQLTHADATVSYTFLGAEPAAGTWAPATAELTVPGDVTRLSVFHVLAGVGTLVVDDTALIADPPACVPPVVNGVPNGDFESACPPVSGVPAGWTGSPGATYADTSSAHDGSHAESIANSLDGQEAGLSTAIAAPTPGQRYALSFWQSSSTYVYAYLAIVGANGTTSYQSLPSEPATQGAWSRYTDAFVVPAGTTSLTLTIATSGIGTVVLDEVALTPLASQTPATFSAGMVSLTFDDGDQSVYPNAWPTLKADGFRSTFYLNAATLNTSGFLTTTQVRTLASAGNEIGSHLYHHSDIAQLDDATLRSELSGNISTLHRILGSTAPIPAFASPYGSFTSGALDTVMQYHASHRTTDGAMNTKADLDPRIVHAKLVTASMSASTIASLVRQAQNTHSWLVLVYHNVAASSASQPPGEAGLTVTPTLFKNQLAAIKNSGVTVAPLSSALRTLLAQT